MALSRWEKEREPIESRDWTAMERIRLSMDVYGCGAEGVDSRDVLRLSRCDITSSGWERPRMRLRIDWVAS